MIIMLIYLPCHKQNCFSFFSRSPDDNISLRTDSTTGVIPKSLPVLSTEPVLRKAAVDRELRFSTEQYECRQKNGMILTPLQGRKRKF